MITLVRQLAALWLETDDADPGLMPGQCPSPAQEREEKAYLRGGASLCQWSRKILTDQPTDRARLLPQC